MTPFSAGTAVSDCGEKTAPSTSSCQPLPFQEGPNRLLAMCRLCWVLHRQVELPWSMEHPHHSTPLLWHEAPVTPSRKLPPLQPVNPFLNQQHPQRVYPLPNPHLLRDHLYEQHTVPNLLMRPSHLSISLRHRPRALHAPTTQLVGPGRAAVFCGPESYWLWCASPWW